MSSTSGVRTVANSASAGATSSTSGARRLPTPGIPNCSGTRSVFFSGIRASNSAVSGEVGVDSGSGGVASRNAITLSMRFFSRSVKIGWVPSGVNPASVKAPPNSPLIFVGSKASTIGRRICSRFSWVVFSWRDSMRPANSAMSDSNLSWARSIS